MKKRILMTIFVFVLCLTCALPVFAEKSRLSDGADLLDSSQEQELVEILDQISETYQVDVVVVTVTTTGGITADEYIEKCYDADGYGYGESRDGVMLLVAMEERDYRILSNGFGADAISMDDIDDIGEDVASYLSDGKYIDAFRKFAYACEYEIDGEINGFPFPFGFALGISLVIGLVAAIIVTFVLRCQLKSVGRKPAASEYAKPGSMKVTHSNEVFLYHTLNRVKREKSSSRSGGSSRNVGGGKF